MKAVFVLFLLFVYPVAVSAASFDVNPGTSIQDVIDAASSGDEIHINNGTYTEPVTIDKPLVLSCQSNTETIINAGSSNIGISLISGADNVTIQNCKITGNGDGINADSVSNLTLQNLIVDNNSFAVSGVYANNITGLNISGTTFSNNIIGLDLVGTTSGVIVSTSTFTNNSTYHISNDTFNTVTATDGNSWGSFDFNTINDRLYDKRDVDSLGLVIFDNANPTVDAGADKIAKAGFTQDATTSDTYGIASYSWEKVSGPGTVTFNNTAIEDPNISTNTDGVYSIKLTVIDISGNTNSDTFQLTWDTVNPTASWDSPAADSSISGTVTLQVSASDSPAGVASILFQYKRNDGIDSFHDTPALWDTTSLPLDNYTIRAVVTDNAGNSTNIDRIVGVAAVITGQSSSTTSTNSFMVTWTTDRPTSGRIIYDTASHPVLGAAPNYGYAFSTGTTDTSPETTSHTITVSGLSDNTVYYWRMVSAGSPTVVSDEYQNKTFSVAGAGTSTSTSTPTSTPLASVLGAAVQPQYFAAATPVEEVLGVSTEPSPTPTATLLPSPTPEVQGASTSNFNWWWVFIPLALLGLVISGLLFRRRS